MTDHGNPGGGDPLPETDWVGGARLDLSPEIATPSEAAPQEISTHDDAPRSVIQAFPAIQTTGLLWLFNRVALHPRGYAVAWTYDTDDNLLGWQLLGDGTEPWKFTEPIDDDSFARLETFLAARKGPTT